MLQNSSPGIVRKFKNISKTRDLSSFLLLAVPLEYILAGRVYPVPAVNVYVNVYICVEIEGHIFFFFLPMGG